MQPGRVDRVHLHGVSGRQRPAPPVETPAQHELIAPLGRPVLRHGGHGEGRERCADGPGRRRGTRQDNHRDTIPDAGSVDLLERAQVVCRGGQRKVHSGRVAERNGDPPKVARGAGGGETRERAGRQQHLDRRTSSLRDRLGKCRQAGPLCTRREDHRPALSQEPPDRRELVEERLGVSLRIVVAGYPDERRDRPPCERLEVR